MTLPPAPSETDPPEIDYEVEIVDASTPKPDPDAIETDHIKKEGDPFGDNFA
jgi:hypothetical protein